jgi:VanZ family protein
LKLLKITSLWAPVFGFMVLIYSLSSRESLPASELVWDKAMHVGAYGVFGLLCLRAFHGGIRPLRAAPTVLAMLTTLLYAMLDEMHQSRVPGRDPSLVDWVADTIGAGLALLFVAWLGGRRVMRKREP